MMNHHPSKCTDTTQAIAAFPTSSPPCLQTPPQKRFNQSKSAQALPAITPVVSQRRHTETYASPRPIPTAIYNKLLNCDPNQASFYILQKGTPHTAAKSRGRKSQAKEEDAATTPSMRNKEAEPQWRVARRSRRSLSRGRFHDVDEVYGVADSPRGLLELMRQDEEVKKEIGRHEVLFPASLTTAFPEPWKESMRVKGDRAFISLPPSPRQSPHDTSIGRKQTDREASTLVSRRSGGRRMSSIKTDPPPPSKSPHHPRASPQSITSKGIHSPTMAEGHAKPVMIPVPNLSHSTGVWLAYNAEAAASSDTDMSDSDPCMQLDTHNSPAQTKQQRTELAPRELDFQPKTEEEVIDLDVPTKVVKVSTATSSENRPPGRSEEWKLCVSEEHSSIKAQLMRENALKELKSLKGFTAPEHSSSCEVEKPVPDKPRVASQPEHRLPVGRGNTRARNRLSATPKDSGRLAKKSGVTPAIRQATPVQSFSKARVPPMGGRRESHHDSSSSSSRSLWPENLTQSGFTQGNRGPPTMMKTHNQQASDRKTPLPPPKLPPSRRSSEKPRASALPKHSSTPTLTVTSLLKRLAQHSRELRGATPIDSTPVQRSEASWMLTPMKVIPAHPVAASENSPSHCILDHRQHSPIVAPQRKSLASIVRSND